MIHCWAKQKYLFAFVDITFSGKKKMTEKEQANKWNDNG